MEQYQLRVVAEEMELSERLERLRAFIEDAKFRNLPFAEQERMGKQLRAMDTYQEALRERIAAWGETK